MRRESGSVLDLNLDDDNHCSHFSMGKTKTFKTNGRPSLHVIPVDNTMVMRQYVLPEIRSMFQSVRDSQTSIVEVSFSKEFHSYLALHRTAG
jgi:hypothetical protein